LANRLTLPPRLAQEVARFRDGIGHRWLELLPVLVSDCCARWGLELQTPFPYPSLSYVCPVLLPDCSHAVLKVGFLKDELAREADALRAYDGRGCVALLQADVDAGALLLERLSPGADLTGMPDDGAAVSAAAAVMRRLRRTHPAGHAFPSVSAWADELSAVGRRFRAEPGPISVALIERAEGLMRDLLTSAPEPVLLHGDLQHYNVLSARREPWLAIDPKGFVGEPACEVGAFVRNHQGNADRQRLLARRIHQFSEELSLDRERIMGWAEAGAVLSAWWSVEDGGDGWSDAVACAEAVRSLR